MGEDQEKMRGGEYSRVITALTPDISVRPSVANPMMAHHNPIKLQIRLHRQNTQTKPKNKNA
jgi:hypothetical protein